MTETYTARITPALALELAGRGIAEAPFDRITGPATLTLSADEAQLLLDDCDLYGDTEGPGHAVTFGMRQAYCRLGASLRDQGLRPTVVEWEPGTYVPLPPPTPQQLGTFAPGTWVVHPVLGRMAVADVDRVPASRRHGELVALRNGTAGDLAWREATELVTTR